MYPATAPSERGTLLQFYAFATRYEEGFDLRALRLRYAFSPVKLGTDVQSKSPSPIAQSLEGKCESGSEPVRRLINHLV